MEGVLAKSRNDEKKRLTNNRESTCHASIFTFNGKERDYLAEVYSGEGEGEGAGNKKE